MADFAADDFPAIARRMREIEAERAHPGVVVVGLEIAAGHALDAWGTRLDCPRRPVEPDADYRARLRAEMACSVDVELVTITFDIKPEERSDG